MRALVRFDNPPEAAVFLWHSYEREVERVIEVVLGPGQAALDIGANCGVVTLAMRAAIGPTGRVISVDPSPFACRRVQEQAALNQVDNIEVVCAALGAEETVAQYFRSRVGLGALPTFDIDLTTHERVTAKVTTVDQLLRSCGLDRVALIKIDTDGSECSILEGARATLHQHRPVVVCEFYPAGLRRLDRSSYDQARLLLDADYRLLRPCFRRSSRLLARPPRLKYFEPIDLADLPEEGAHNILALHREDQRHLDLFERLAARHGGDRTPQPPQPPYPERSH
jgi:FkbM family methyltransferase